MATNIYSLLDRRELLVDDIRKQQLIHRALGHSSVVERLGFSCSLEDHRGCVNCIQWNADGSLLASGSDDLSVIVWDPYRRKAVAAMPTGHTGNIFSVKFAPFSGDRLVLSGAEDKEVRLHDLSSFETIKVWSCSPGRVKRLAVSPHSPYLCWSAAEDGCVRQFDRREPHACSDEGCRNVLIDLKLTCGAVSGSTQCKCISVSPTRPEQIAVGAMDPYVRIYDTRVCSLRRSAKQEVQYGDPSCLAHFAPGHISSPHSVPRRSRKSYNSLATTYLSFSPNGTELLVNLSGEHIYLYDVVHFREALKYDFVESATKSDSHRTGASLNYSSTKNGVTRPGGMVNPSRCGASWERIPGLVPGCVVTDQVQRLKVRGLELHNARKYAEAVREFTVALRLCPSWCELYALRAASLYARSWEGDMYAALRDAESALSLCPSHQGALRRRLCCLQHLKWNKAADHLLQAYAEQYPNDSEFIRRTRADLEQAFKTESESKNGYHSDRKPHPSQWELNRQRSSFDYRTRFCGHCNTHTDIKEANFIGEMGEYVAAGSDDGNIFIWEKASGLLVRVLHGDDSIVNCVQWHPNVPMLATSGIENVIKLWEPKPPGHEESLEVKNRMKVCSENQRRMKVDPFEMMLMRMGFQVAMAQDIVHQVVQEHMNPSPSPSSLSGGGGGGDGGEQEPLEERGGGGDGERRQRSGRRGRGERAGQPGEAGGEADQGQVRWIEDPTSCRQS